MSYMASFRFSNMAKAALAVLFFSLLMCIPPSRALPPPSQPTSDQLTLLSVKSMLSGGSLASWNMSSSYCSWPGVICGGRRHPKRVVALRLGSQNLSGRVSPFLGNLSFLRELDLSDNHLAGQIPLELGRLVRLRVLNLMANSLQGSIPVALGGGCTNLTMLDLSSNRLQGEIPTAIGASLKNLAYLNLSVNDLSGEIPRSLADLPVIEVLSLSENRLSGGIQPGLGNLSNLWNIGLEKNMLSGDIPSSLGMLHRLSRFSISTNFLSGAIPNSLWNISSLQIFSVLQNMLNGTIPPNAFSSLSHLKILAMDQNRFHGHIPASIANSSGISILQIGDNFFTGIIPPEIGKIKDINFIQISVNSLEAKEPKDWEFITALTNCSRLRVLEFGDNELEGALPDSFSNLSTLITNLIIRNNKISGSIPKDIGNIHSLQYLDLSNNYFTGALPCSLGRLKNLNEFDASQNKISRSIPWTIGNISELNHLSLNMNALSGRLPSTLGNFTKLLALDLSANKFTGTIPTGLFNSPTLFFLYLSDNNLEGSLPQEIGNLKNLVEFRAESNRISGEIPTTLGECQVLQNLFLQSNILIGGIPSSLSQLKGLENLDLSSNNISGQIPMFLGNVSMLNYLNLSFNRFVGEVPKFGVFANATAISIQGNEKLCGGIPDLHLPPCSSQVAKRTSLAIPIAVPLAAAVVILSLLCISLCWRNSTTRIPSTESMQGHLFLSYPQLARATDGFSTTSLLGSGAFGTVFKGNLGARGGESTNFVAVKVLKLQTPGALKSFVAECEALRNLRHRNLVKIITACSSVDSRGNDFKAIVFDFMPNGSLEDWLHPVTNGQPAKYLTLFERVTILLDVANALDYLHCHSHAPVVHCDLKPSNVLLDAEMVAHVGDFGLAKILVEASSFQQSASSMGFRGTIGYAPPEYGAGNMVSTSGDIYSYGILVLETITGKRPTDSRFIEGSSIRQYVELGLGGRVMEVVDTQMSLALENEPESLDDSAYRRNTCCLISLLGVGLSCSQEMPSSRMTTGDILKELNAIKESLLL